MFRETHRKLAAKAAVAALAVAGLTLTLVTPVQAATAVPAPAPSPTTTEITAASVPETQQRVVEVLAANGASRAWPAVNADLIPRLNDAVAKGGGDVLSSVIALPFKITIKCEITFPPLKIHCTIEISFSATSSTTDVTTASVGETQQRVSEALAVNGASEAFPAVNADLTPKLNEAVARNSGDVLSSVLSLPFKITIRCTITYPPLQIHCTIVISL
jgi:hypothetical protein